MLIIETRNALPGPRSRGKRWLQTAILAVLAITFAVAAFFFIAVALAAGPLEGEYAVIEDAERDQRRR